MEARGEREAFLAAVRAAPDDMTPRLVYADWLDERGDPDGELVRLLCEVQLSHYADGPAWERLVSLLGDPDAELGRLGERPQRLLACEAAERLLPLFEGVRPDDHRPRRAIEVGRRYARGEATWQELDAARTGSVHAATESVSARQPGAVLAAWVAVHPVPADALHEDVWTDLLGQWAAQRDKWAAERPDLLATWTGHRRWQLCRAIEYRLGFVPQLGFGGPSPTLP